MRVIRVRNASILAKIDGREIDVEIRTTKDSARGIALFIDGKKIIDLDYQEGNEKQGLPSVFVDGRYYDDKPALLQLNQLPPSKVRVYKPSGI